MPKEFNGTKVAAERDYSSLDLQVALNEFDRLRSASVNLLDHTPAIEHNRTHRAEINQMPAP